MHVCARVFSEGDFVDQGKVDSTLWIWFLAEKGEHYNLFLFPEDDNDNYSYF